MHSHAFILLCEYIGNIYSHIHMDYIVSYIVSYNLTYLIFFAPETIALTYPPTWMNEWDEFKISESISTTCPRTSFR